MEASTEGVLGGYGCVNDVDVKGSDAFIRPLLADRFGTAKRHLVALGEFIYYCKEVLASAIRACLCASFVLVISLCESYCVIMFILWNPCVQSAMLLCVIFHTVSDCGSGIGRVTKNFLLRHFNEVWNLSSLVMLL